MLTIFPGAVILRPSIIFGPEDNFFNQFAAMAQAAPGLPLIGGGRTKFQPVYVGDVALAVLAAAEGRAQPGEVYELGGPKVFTFKQILQFILKVTGRKKPLIPIPFAIARIQGFILQYLPGKLLTVDQVRMLKKDNIVSNEALTEARTLRGLGIQPRGVESIVPGYLMRFKKLGQFSAYRHLEPR